MPKINEYDYLHIAARIHAMEGHMLTRERTERMLDARTAEEAAKVLTECGYEDLTSLTPTAIEHMLTTARQGFFADLRKSAPDPGIVDVFCMKYDYHNAKAILKAEAMSQDPAPLLIDAGRYPVALLQEDYAKEDLRHQSEIFRGAVTKAKEVLALTGDPQASDFVLDTAYFEELLEAAKAANSPFLMGYVRLLIDATNLRTAVRAARMGQELPFLQQVLVPGGSIPTEPVAQAATGTGDLAARYSRTPLEAAAAAGVRALAGGSLTEFERLCDDAVTGYLLQAKRIAFGEHPLIGYLYAREAELTTIRVILSGRMAGLETDTIRERLREAYV
ncbi:MAG: V-type ATPase subunit [Pseudoflavonifractor sp.]